ncbi:tetrahydromethanopterin S-methyltransferase subunit F [Saccharothrix tamanrassetensis]|uniref:Tetrahydromethanopterin S-methyltransferase subunit F n=1 Tax=Saccharothrix tamanrassetensis TaxID=1051531 RepID=A0A841CD86_9PSEU|nr:CbtA family protein [Saccharothrix tamanrassetensis]MBB5954138.1 tetrahydromethanopterin S-methyltransferase subunit F [Saccharothrix tamanrassetensis]
MNSYRSVLLRGVGAGGIAGLLAGLVGLFVVEVPIRAALAVEEARAATEPVEPGGHDHGELFGRGTQLVGGVLAAVIVGLAVGALFATAYAGSRRWFTDRPPFSRSVSLAAAVFGAAALLPAIKYPANPPAVGDPNTVGYRTVLYLGVIAAGLLVVFGASYLASRLGHLSRPVRSTAVALAVIAGFTVILLAFPAPPDAIPEDMPSNVLWDFRLASLAETATLWLGLGVVFGLLIDPAVRTRSGSKAKATALGA